jgi:hypothetical protein
MGLRALQVEFLVQSTSHPTPVLAERIEGFVAQLVSSRGVGGGQPYCSEPEWQLHCSMRTPLVAL